MSGAHPFTADEIAVIRQRHFGWEKATPRLLADVFRVPVQRISAVLREGLVQAAPVSHSTTPAMEEV